MRKNKLQDRYECLMSTTTIEQTLIYMERCRSYDLLQAQTSHGWGPLWTFVVCDLLAAEQAALMLKRLKAISVRHARRANLYIASRDVTETVVIITELPSQFQVIWRLRDHRQLLTPVYLQDECLTALSSGLTIKKVSEQNGAAKLVARRKRSRAGLSSSANIKRVK